MPRKSGAAVYDHLMNRTSPFDHVDLRVRSLAAARKLYDAFLPAVGFSEVDASDGSVGYFLPDALGAKPPFVYLSEDVPDHRGGANRIAFWAGSVAEVDRVAGIVLAAGALVVDGPEYCHEYTPGYYAVFFEDADGNKWEVCFRDAPVRPHPPDA